MNFLLLIVLVGILSTSCADDEKQAPKYSTPIAKGDVYLQEPFDSDDAIDSWTVSKAKKDDVDSEIAKYDGKWKVESPQENALPGDLGLVLKSKARHHAIAVLLDKPFVFDSKPFIVQYEVNFQTGIECGGAYMKLLTHTEDLNLEQFQDKTPYTIMFGPDKCGEDYKLHFIFRHKNPKTGEFEEKHAKKPTVDIKSYYTDKATHLYTLMLTEDNNFKIYIDHNEVNSGSLLTDFSPPVNPPKEIEDKDDKKPEDWDEREKIADPEASKPDDWDEDAPAKTADPDAEMPDGWLEDEPLYVDDPDAAKPEDWDDEMDGEWEAPKVDNPKCSEVAGCGTWEPPMISNPAYKGKWRPPMISNPNYKGIWKPRIIPNPDFFEDSQPFKMFPIGAVGFELWSMSEDILFDNIIITSDKQVSDEYAEKTWKMKKQVQAENEPGFVQGLLSATEERPWLWIIYVLVVGLPLVLLFTFCCSGGKKADPKKTDEATPDDPHDSEEEKEAEEGSQKDATESQGEEDGGDEVSTARSGEEEEEGGDGEKPVTKADLEKDEEDVDDDDSGPVRRSPRKRKPRVQD
uniref:Calnexin n=1 Tax=Phallusia mammillata TaxID=59560 RepID=A0A6F9D8V3_9ASCI|nr:calnexin [Phallusia mammillata]